MSRAAESLLGPLEKVAEKRWIGSLRGSLPRPSRADYECAAANALAVSNAVVRIQQRTGHVIDEKWLWTLALHAEVVIKASRVSLEHGRLLYSWLRSYLSQQGMRTVNILETGTGRGFSAVTMARALADADTEGKIVTLDVLPHRVPMLWNCIDDVDGPRTRAELLDEYAELVARYIVFVQGDSLRSLAHLDLSRVHFAFLDGMHSELYVAEEFAWVAARQECGDVIVFDDFNEVEFPGLVRAVERGLERYKYEPNVVDVGQQRRYLKAVRR